MKPSKSFLPLLFLLTDAFVQGSVIVDFNAINQFSGSSTAGDTRITSDSALNTTIPILSDASSDYSGPAIYRGFNKIDGSSSNMQSRVADANGSGIGLRTNGDNDNQEGDALYLFQTSAARFSSGLDDDLAIELTINGDAVEDVTGIRLESASFRWVIEDSGSFYVSNEIAFDLQDARDNDNYTQTFTADGLLTDWYDYDPTGAATTITNSIGSSASPALSDIDWVGFLLSVNSRDSGTAKSNFGITAFTANGSTTEPLVVENKPNILFIAVDDLVPTLGAYGDATMLANNGTPEIDALASQGTVFLNHHVNFPICGASRIALTTSLMPDETGVTAFQAMRHPNRLPDVVTLPQHFKNNGYETAARGKFHDKRTVGDTTQPLELIDGDERYPDGFKFDDPASWSIAYSSTSGDKDTGMTGRPVAFAGLNSGTYQDERIMRAGRNLLDTLEAGNKPFFLAVGFKKPHLAFIAPQRYWDIHDTNNNGDYTDDMDIPDFMTDPVNAGTETVEMFDYNDEFLSYDTFSSVPTTPADIRWTRHGYYACVSMIDDLVGDLLDRLATKDDPVQVGKKMNETTIVVLWGDHGFALGEHNRWGKHTAEDLSSWAPLIIYDPRNPGNGAQTMAPVTCIDLFPTLCELAGLPIPTQPLDSVTLTGRPLRGRSLVPILEDPTASVNGGALVHKTQSGLSYIYRTEQYRLIEHYNEGTTVVERELYDLSVDRVERINLAGDPAYAAVLHELSTAMRNESSAQAVSVLQNEPPAAAPSDRTLPGLKLIRDGSNLEFSWPAAPGSGSTYALTSTTDLAQSFTSLPGQESLTTGGAALTMDNSKAFFLVELDENKAPFFKVDPIAGTNAVSETAYTGTLAGSATDEGTVTYLKVDGPDWLSVATNGTLSGTPAATDIGANYFTISATDLESATTRAKLLILVE
ncbi:MAG: sulfatase-like hydrolase/transferase [Verrucomicrobiota bacterium]